MTRSSLPWLVVGAVVVAAVLAWLTLSRGAGVGSGQTREAEHHPLAPFSEIEVGGTAEIVLIQGPVEAIDVDAAPRTVVEATVSNGRLTIHARDRRRWWNRLFGHHGAEGAAITVHLRTLERLALTGNVNVAAPRLATKSLRIGASGGATLSIDDLQATTLRVDGSGALKADLAGRVDNEHVSISGAGTYRGERLRANEATVSVSGVGNVVVNVERKLRANISGAGLIEYVGEPQVVENVSGLGRVRRRDQSAVPGMRVASLSSLKNRAACVTGSMSG